MENTVFNRRFVELVDVKPRVRRLDCIFIGKMLCISGSVQLKLVLFKGQLFCGKLWGYIKTKKSSLSSFSVHICNVSKLGIY